MSLESSSSLSAPRPQDSEVTPLLNPDVSHSAPCNTGAPQSSRGQAASLADAATKAKREPRLASPAYRIAAAMFSFVVLGLLTGTIGVILPYLQNHYQLSDTGVSLVFLIQPVGYVLAARLNGLIHLRFGQRGIAAIAPLFHLVFVIVAASHPPFAVFLIALAVGAFGTGLLDGSWCAWAAAMERGNTMSGLLHGSFSVGSAVGPFMAGQLLSVRHMPWYHWYTVLAGVCVVEIIVLLVAFRKQNATEYQQPQLTRRNETTAKRLLSYQQIWVCAVYLLVYAGTEASISGWIVIFMIRARHVTVELGSICSAGFWAGMAIGRVLLGLITDIVGVKIATSMYILLAMLLQLLFAAIDLPVLSIIIMSFLGFFLGPLFPSGILRLTNLLPRESHVVATSFVASIGQVGAALLPFGLGTLVQTVGIRSFQIVIFVQLAITLLVWIYFSYQINSDAIEEEINDEQESI